MSDRIDTIEDLELLEQQVGQLLNRCEQLEEENRSLRNSQEQLVAERANLVAKNEQARSRVEAMISRLKSLEQGA